MKAWLTREEALGALGVRAQTLYAYASRGQIAVRSDPDAPRRSLYSGEDVARAVERRARGKRPLAIAASTIAWGEPIIDTAIATIAQGRLVYRGRDAVRFSDAASLEQAAALLWDVAPAPVFPPCRADDAPGGTPRARAFATMARAADAGTPTFGRGPERLVAEAASLVGCLATAFGAAPDEGPLHLRFGAAWNRDAAATEAIRRALVLLADQELTTSAFAARVAASTGATLAACVLSGLSALSGPLHGGATARVATLFEEAARTGVDEVVRRHIASGLLLPGFGHPLYPGGDPRAAALLDAFDPPPGVADLIGRVFDATGLRPTIDVALAALAQRFALPADAHFTIFAMGRSIGWLAHSLEQVGAGSLIRPRARYIGPPPPVLSDAPG